MQIDWFTFLAQIFNFLLLVALLSWVLYRPITRAMAEREQKIADRLNQAARARAEAEAEARQYQTRLRDLEAQREEWLGQARRDVETRQKQWLAEARSAATAARTEWAVEVARDRNHFLRELRRRAGQSACTLARRALQELASADLEEQILSIFLARVTRTLRSASPFGQVKEATLYSTWEVEAERRAAVTEILRQLLGPDVSLRYETTTDLICGVALQTAGRRIDWNLSAYLDELEEEFLQLLTRSEEQSANSPEPAGHTRGSAALAEPVEATKPTQPEPCPPQAVPAQRNSQATEEQHVLAARPAPPQPG